MFVVGDGDCGQFGKGEDVTEALRPAPSPLPEAAGQARALVSAAVCGVCIRHLLCFLRVLEACAATAPEGGRLDPPVAGQVCSYLMRQLVLRQVVQVAAGGMHSVALTARGEVFTTGVNDEGALGRCTGGVAKERVAELLIIMQCSLRRAGGVLEPQTVEQMRVHILFVDMVESVYNDFAQLLLGRLCGMHCLVQPAGMCACGCYLRAVPWLCSWGAVGEV